MLTKRIFLASSSELKEDRKEFEILINRKNKDWVDKGVFIDLIVWEDFLDALSKTRLQDEYNRAIRECDIFVMLFCTKVGQYTEEEFETAFGQFKATNKPFIFTYFKDAQISIGSANESNLMSLWAFKNKLGGLGHFYTVYKNTDELKLHFNQQLDKLAKNGFIERNETHPPEWGVLANHNADLIQRFGREDWPYDLDKNQFVRAVEYVVGDLKCRERPIDDRDCLMHLKSEAGNRPLAIVGYYGMGKTTLMKMLFASLAENGTDTVPIFLSLSNRRLRDVEHPRLGDTLAQVIASNRAVATDARQVKTIQRTVDELIDSRRLLILFDGIDEALTADRAELVTFLKQLHESGLRYVLTSRLEYSPFFDVGRQIFPAGHLAVVELTDWGPNQWALYVKALVEELPGQRYLVDRFAARLESRHYANLPARPLFLRMLADLEARNDTGIIINERLSGNLSEVYFKFISWKVMDDYNRKGGVDKFDAGAFRLEAFDLLSQLATVEYKRGRTGQEGAIRLGDMSTILALGEFQVLKDHATEFLLDSSLFSILRRSDENAFQFSHKSFMEYLVAHLYAATIFASPGDPSKSTCTGVWGEYQTHEVSQHFLREVERIQVSENLTEARVLDHFREAFVAALRDDVSGDPGALDQRIQSVLYYAGRLRLWDDQIQSKLHSILANPDSHHKIYRRTASIALGILESPKYIDEYVFFLLNHSSERNSDFDLNLSISKEYYGVPGVERVLREDLEKFLSGAERNPILSLRLLTYWAYMAEVNPSSGPEVRKIVDAALTEARRQKLDGLERVCARILESWPREEP